MFEVVELLKIQRWVYCCICKLHSYHLVNFSHCVSEICTKFSTRIHECCFALLDSTHDQNMLMLNADHTCTCSNMWSLYFSDIPLHYCIFVAQYFKTALWPHLQGSDVHLTECSIPEEQRSKVHFIESLVTCSSLLVWHGSHSHVSAKFNLSVTRILSHYFFVSDLDYFYFSTQDVCVPYVSSGTAYGYRRWCEHNSARSSSVYSASGRTWAAKGCD